MRVCALTDECLHLLLKRRAGPMRKAPTVTGTTWSLAARARAFPSHCLPRALSAVSASPCCAIVTDLTTPLSLGSPRGIAGTYRGQPRGHPSAGYLRQLRQSGRLPHQCTQPLQQRRHRPLRGPTRNRPSGNVTSGQNRCHIGQLSHRHPSNEIERCPLSQRKASR